MMMTMMDFLDHINITASNDHLNDTHASIYTRQPLNAIPPILSRCTRRGKLALTGLLLCPAPVTSTLEMEVEEPFECR